MIAAVMGSVSPSARCMLYSYRVWFNGLKNSAPNGAGADARRYRVQKDRSGSSIGGGVGAESEKIPIFEPPLLHTGTMND